MYNKTPRVLVCVVRAGPKNYAFKFYPRFASFLFYKNRETLLVDENNCKKLRGQNVGEIIAATGRQFGIEYARKHDFDYIYFMDLDFEPHEGTLTRLVDTGHPLVGSLVAARGDENLIIGHNYSNREKLTREPLYWPDLKEGQEVGGIGGCSLLVHKSIFSKVDYEYYVGPETIPGRFTADDEYLQIQIYNKLKIKPRIILNPSGWHYSDDGYKYKIPGKKERYEY